MPNIQYVDALWITWVIIPQMGLLIWAVGALIGNIRAKNKRKREEIEHRIKYPFLYK